MTWFAFFYIGGAIGCIIGLYRIGSIQIVVLSQRLRAGDFSVIFDLIFFLLFLFVSYGAILGTIFWLISRVFSEH